MGILRPQRSIKQDKDDWLTILAFIGAKRTWEPTFKILFNKLLKDKGHIFHREASLVNERYNFTPTSEFRRDKNAGDRKFKWEKYER